MATQLLTNARIYVAQYDLSAKMNMVKVTVGADMPECTVFTSSFHTYTPALRKASINEEGFVDFGSGSLDDVLSGGAGGTNRIGLADVPVSVSATGNAGDPAWFLKALHSQLEYSGRVGELLKFTLNAEASGAGTQLVAGMILEDGSTLRTTAGNSTPVQINAGGVSASQKLYGAVHVLAQNVTSLTLKIRSAATSGGTYTDRLTFSTITGLTSEIPNPVSGPVTDTWWRVDWTGTFTSFKAVAIAGIQ